jgi:hypothetical protein
MLAYHDNAVHFEIADGDGAMIQITGHSQGVKQYWHHIVGVYDGSTMKMYSNGNFLAESKASKKIQYRDDAMFEIAAYMNNEPYMQLGNLVRTVRLHKGSMDPARIESRFNEMQQMVEHGILVPDQLHFTSGPFLQWATQDGMTIVWETDRPTTGVLKWGPKVNFAHEIPSTESKRIHEVRISGLEPGTHYFYQVEATDSEGGVLPHNRQRQPAGAGAWKLQNAFE